MPRLAIAVIAALAAHVLLLMTILPEPQVSAPKIQGAGHITVSIVRPPPPVPEAVKEPVKEPEPVTELEPIALPAVNAAHEEEAGQLPLPASEPPVRKPEPVKKKIVPVDRAAESDRATPAARRTNTAEPVAEQAIQPFSDTRATDDEAMRSVEETLRSPEPLAAVNRPPAYPPLARKRGWQGTVLLEVEVQRDGMVASVHIRESSSYELLDSEAVTAVRKWLFSPGSSAGIPVPMKVLVPIHFLLQEN